MTCRCAAPDLNRDGAFCFACCLPRDYAPASAAGVEYQRGALAADRGRGRDACPWIGFDDWGSSMRRAWLDGWRLVDGRRRARDRRRLERASAAIADLFAA